MIDLRPDICLILFLVTLIYLFSVIVGAAARWDKKQRQHDDDEDGTST